mgnify:CR=1 FL=1
MADWAWRVPFLLGAVLAVAAWWIRRSAAETLVDAGAPARANGGAGRVAGERVRQRIRDRGGVVVVLDGCVERGRCRGGPCEVTEPARGELMVTRQWNQPSVQGGQSDAF